MFDVTLSLPSFLCGVLLLHDDLPHGCKVSDCVSSLFFDWVYAVYVSIGSMQSLVSCGQQLELAVSAVLQSVTTHEASALEAARFAAVSAFIGGRSLRCAHVSAILARAPGADRPIHWSTYCKLSSAFRFRVPLSFAARQVCRPSSPLPNECHCSRSAVRLASLWICS